LQDIIGSTRDLRDDSKVEKGRYWYYPYGDVYSQSGEAIRYMFTGKEWDDDAQMYYFPFRYYSPGIGRWMTRDPSGMVDGPNVYAYVGANPVKHWDKDGRQLAPWEEELLWHGLAPYPWLVDRINDLGGIDEAWEAVNAPPRPIYIHIPLPWMDVECDSIGLGQDLMLGPVSTIRNYWPAGVGALAACAAHSVTGCATAAIGAGILLLQTGEAVLDNVTFIDAGWTSVPFLIGYWQ